MSTEVSPADHPQAGGGVPAQSRPEKIPEFSATWIRLVGQFQKDISSQFDFSTPDGFQTFFREYQKIVSEKPENLARTTSRGPVETLLTYLASPYADAANPLKPPKDFYQHPLPAYYISSSHNTYLQHNQLIGDASVDTYKDVLRRGCRCVEIDIWDGKNAGEDDSDQEKRKSLRSRFGSIKDRFRRAKSTSESSATSDADSKTEQVLQPPAPWRPSQLTAKEPRVLHGHTLTKEIPFRSVCEAIRDTAFVTSQLPVIVSLEVHCNFEGQQMIVDIIRNTWRHFLVNLPSLNGADAPLPSPEDLRQKILVKVKYTSPEKAKSRKLKQAEDTGQSAESSGAEDEEEQEIVPNSTSEPVKQKKKGMLQSLSDLGIYTRAYHFKSFDQPEASLPSHVFSLSEGALAEAHATRPDKLFNHNRKFLMRCYPKGMRVSSSNLNPVPFWRRGVQMAALNFQSMDKSMMLNEGMFAGSGGYVLKPPEYRDAAKARRPHKILDLRIEVFATQSLPLPEHRSKIHPYITASLHTEGLIPEKGGRNPTLLVPTTSAQPSVTASSDEGETKLERKGSTKRPLLGRRRSSSDHFKSGQASPIKMKQRTATARHEHGHGHTDAPRNLAAEADFKREALVWRDVEIDDEALCFIRFKVRDDIEMARDELVGWSCVRLDRLGDGLRVFRLFDAKGRESEGRVLVRIEKAFRELGSSTATEDFAASEAAVASAGTGNSSTLPVR